MKHEDIKAISFDVWKTLINPSQTYGRERNKIIAEHLQVSVEYAGTVYKNCKKFFDTIAELNGTCFSTSDCWKILCQMADKKDVDYIKLMNECQYLFAKHLPEFNPELVNELQKLKNAGYILAITSNTNFISGSTLYNNIFKNWDVFSTCIFSDAYEVAKPDQEIFGITFSDICDVVENEHPYLFETSKVLHIGDNKICDAGATDFGFKFQYVQNPEDLLSKLQNNEII